MASISFPIGRTKFIFEGTTPIPINTFESNIRSVREENIENEWPGVPAGAIWSSYFPGMNPLNSFVVLTPQRNYEVDAIIPFTLEY